MLCVLFFLVYSARDLQAHKKGGIIKLELWLSKLYRLPVNICTPPDVCHASVVFGHGKDFYTTEMVQSCTPEWNQEASM